MATKAKAKAKKVEDYPDMPKVGAAAPAFTAEMDDGSTFKLADYKGKKNVVLYFYPKDDTSGCTAQACAFQDDAKAYDKLDAVVIGVSKDNAKSHVKFKEKYKLKFPLLVDEEQKLANKYGTWVQKSMYGRKYMGMQRATFLIGKDGKVAAVWPKVKVDGHTKEVLAALKDL